MREPFDGMIGDCPAMQRVFDAIERLAPSDLTLLVLGETGTGKELVARSIHRRSRRASGPFVAINCAALPLGLVESELFGFEKGAFTGAVAAHVGVFERAGSGTLFLDEIAELPLEIQAKLLRVVQDLKVRRIGGDRDRQVDVRLVAATHQDLPAQVVNGAFRRDLFHRLEQSTLILPPLRDRGVDLDRIADTVLHAWGQGNGRAPRLSAEGRAALHAHTWPGNVREMENVLRRAVTLAGDRDIEAGDLRLDAGTPPRTLAEVVDVATESALRSAARRHGGDWQSVARELGIPLVEARRLAARFRVSEDGRT